MHQLKIFRVRATNLDIAAEVKQSHADGVLEASRGRKGRRLFVKDDSITEARQ